MVWWGEAGEVGVWAIVGAIVDVLQMAIGLAETVEGVLSGSGGP